MKISFPRYGQSNSFGFRCICVQPGGANYESKGGTPLPRVGPRSQGWDPDHKGRTPLPRVWHFQKNHCISIQNTKKGKIYTGLCHAIVKDVSFLLISIIYHLIVWFDCILPLNIFHAKTAQTVIFFHLGRDGYKYLGKKWPTIGKSFLQGYQKVSRNFD